ncbi:type II secretion system protein GspM [Jeongeupia sp. HS-3]|uniref:type II secretion system protein GspM n=1 Tax=Jeongeupia sp. HS-3 TaxID=1009682 RepID=UPI0019103E49|nr:type II secretion system protein M [Jeongeupia sp. HS-3]
MSKLHALHTWWRGREPRERIILASGGVIVLAALLYGGVWQPLSSASAKLTRQLPKLQSDLADLQRGVTELKQSGARRPAPAPGEIRQHVQATLDALQLSADLQALPGEQVRIVISRLPFEQVLALLGALENDQNLHIVRADIRGQDGSAQLELVVQP